MGGTAVGIFAIGTILLGGVGVVLGWYVDLNQAEDPFIVDVYGRSVHVESAPPWLVYDDVKITGDCSIVFVDGAAAWTGPVRSGHVWQTDCEPGDRIILWYQPTDSVLWRQWFI